MLLGPSVNNSTSCTETKCCHVCFHTMTRHNDPPDDHHLPRENHDETVTRVLRGEPFYLTPVIVGDRSLSLCRLALFISHTGSFLFLSLSLLPCCLLILRVRTVVDCDLISCELSIVVSLPIACNTLCWIRWESVLNRNAAETTGTT